MHAQRSGALTFPLRARFALATPPTPSAATIDSLARAAPPVADDAFIATTLLPRVRPPVAIAEARDLLLLVAAAPPTTLVPAHAAENDIAVAAMIDLVCL